MSNPKKLIEVAMPIKEISVESMRDKSVRHGHLSTLHLWWARRPLPVCRAVVFASLVPDPLDIECPQAFKDAVSYLLGPQENPGDPYKPYDDIPYTAAIDKMDDTLRNRLMMFIGRFSKRFCENERIGRTTSLGEQLSNASLINCDNKNNETVLNKARKLIWVAMNASNGQTCDQLLAEFDSYFLAIKHAEKNLYNMTDRHIARPEIFEKEMQLESAIEAFLRKMPRVFDPFAGGGAIPLEAARLGCRSFGNDINPVAHIIQKGSLEFPQRYGKPITYSKAEFLDRFNEEYWNQQPQQNKVVEDGEAIALRVDNRLAFEVEFYAKKVISETEIDTGYLFPPDANGDKPLAYYWARLGSCSNPSCKSEIPLLKQFYLSKRRGVGENEWVYLKPVISDSIIDFEIRKGRFEEPGWNERGNLICPVCGNITNASKLKENFKKEGIKERLLAVIEEKANGKEFRIPRKDEIEIIKSIVIEDERPLDKMQIGNNRNFNTPGWSIDSFGQMFSDRQIIVLDKLIKKLNSLFPYQDLKDDYTKAIVTYLALLIDRIAARYNTFCRWHILQDTIEHPFSRQAIPMIFDFPELNIFSEHTNGAFGNLKQIINFINEESFSPFHTTLAHAASGTKEQFPEKYLTATVTDPPYYDAIAYADLSDFFYVWLKKTLRNIYPLNFATPQTPKTEECTALKHHHFDNDELARKHFEDTLMRIFNTLEQQTSDIVSIMFAHQSTEAWTTLCNCILGSRMNITGSWAIDTEMATRAMSISSAALSSSVTVSCRPSQRVGFGDYREVRKAIETTVSLEVDQLYSLGFRGADLLTACFGQAVSVFGSYEKVEKADGSQVTTAELLDLAKDSAFNALLKGFKGDDFTKFYIGWLQLYGFIETDFDDAAKFSRVGLNINVAELFAHYILLKNGNKQTLGTYVERNQLIHHLGEKNESYLIDKVHKAMALFREAYRLILVQFITNIAQSSDDPFWRVLTSLCEILPLGSDDHKQATGLLAIKESLIRESKNLQNIVSEPTIDF